MHWKGAEWLMRRVRDREEAATLMREQLQVKPGMVICDLGCGNGYHSLPLAEAVGETGKIYGVDVQPEMIEMLSKRIEAKGIKNIEPIQGLFHDPKLPPNTCDMILLVDVYHEFSHPVQMLAGMRAALKPDGLLVLVEYRAEDETVPIKVEHKMSKAQIHKEMNANGIAEDRQWKSRPAIIRERGGNPDQVNREISQDRTERERLGINDPPEPVTVADKFSVTTTKRKP
jgi:ubiquinone/menaquinone biosynthesis C-methylase UbiE